MQNACDVLDAVSSRALQVSPPECLLRMSLEDAPVVVHTTSLKGD